MSMIGKIIEANTYGTVATVEVLDKVKSLEKFGDEYRSNFHVVTKYFCKVIDCKELPQISGKLVQILPSDINKIIE